MATKDFANYKSDRGLGFGYIPKTRMLEVFIDFSLAANQLAGVTDSLNLFELPAGTSVVSAGIEQITAGTASNTLTARVNTTAVTAALTGDAAVGTRVATVPAAIPLNVVSAVDFNLLSATAVRIAGIARAWVEVVEGDRPYPMATTAARDSSTGLS